MITHIFLFLKQEKNLAAETRRRRENTKTYKNNCIFLYSSLCASAAKKFSLNFSKKIELLYFIYLSKMCQKYFFIYQVFLTILRRYNISKQKLQETMICLSQLFLKNL